MAPQDWNTRGDGRVRITPDPCKWSQRSPISQSAVCPKENCPGAADKGPRIQYAANDVHDVFLRIS